MKRESVSTKSAESDSLNYSVSADRTLNPSDDTLVLFASQEEVTGGANNPPKITKPRVSSSAKEEDKGVFNFGIDEEPSRK